MPNSHSAHWTVSHIAPRRVVLVKPLPEKKHRPLFFKTLPAARKQIVASCPLAPLSYMCHCFQSFSRRILFCDLTIKAAVSRYSVIFFSHFVWEKRTAATRHDRHNSWASRARLNDDCAPIMAWVVAVPFADYMSDWELVDALSAAKLRSLLTGHFASDFCNYPSKDPFREVVSGVLCWRSFFFFRNYHRHVSTLDGQQDVPCSKVHLLTERNWTDM